MTPNAIGNKESRTAGNTCHKHGKGNEKRLISHEVYVNDAVRQTSQRWAACPAQLGIFGSSSKEACYWVLNLKLNEKKVGVERVSSCEFLRATDWGNVNFRHSTLTTLTQSVQYIRPQFQKQLHHIVFFRLAKLGVRRHPCLELKEPGRDSMQQPASQSKPRSPQNQ